MSRKSQASSLTILGSTEESPNSVHSSGFDANPFDLLGQVNHLPTPVLLPGQALPKFEIAWNSFHQNFFSGVPVLFQRAKISKEQSASDVFRDCRIERQAPRRAIVAAALTHVAVLVFPWPQLPVTSRRNPAFENTELTWSGPIEDLPLLNVPKEKPKASAKTEARQTAPAENTEAFHPRQRIYTDPVHPTHPRQTLINPSAPPEAPKFLPAMPNVVQIAASQVPQRPHMEISEKTLAKLRPKAAKAVATTSAPTPDMPNLEAHTAEISLATSQTGPARPKLEINASSAPRVAARSQSGENAAAPDVPSVASNSPAGASTLIAISATPAPPAPVIPVPQGNLAARVAISPEGKPGASGNSAAPHSGSGNGGEGGNGVSGAGNNSVGISISGGAPKPNANASGLGAPSKLVLPKSPTGLKRPDPNVVVDDPPERTGPPDFGLLPPGAKPEAIFSSKQVYSMNVNMPNLNSATGSWIIHFSELHLGDAAHRTGIVNAPVPIRKVDPKYPQAMMLEHIEGEVILYGVIRRDGTVESIQRVRGIDEQLDANAIAAFAQWKFQPATKDGEAVDLEAIVHIPFRGPERR